MNVLPAFVTTRRVLLAEDDDRLGKSLDKLLQGEGFQTHRVRDGVAAINAILSTKPDVILLDRHLPRLSGDEVCRMVRKTDSVCHIPIVFISGLADTADQLAAFQLGADDYVVKPFAVDELLARVEAVLLRGHRFAGTPGGI